MDLNHSCARLHGAHAPRGEGAAHEQRDAQVDGQQQYHVRGDEQACETGKQTNEQTRHTTRGAAERAVLTRLQTTCTLVFTFHTQGEVSTPAFQPQETPGEHCRETGQGRGRGRRTNEDAEGHQAQVGVVQG